MTTFTATPVANPKPSVTFIPIDAGHVGVHRDSQRLGIEELDGRIVEMVSTLRHRHAE